MNQTVETIEDAMASPAVGIALLSSLSAPQNLVQHHYLVSKYRLKWLKRASW